MLFENANPRVKNEKMGDELEPGIASRAPTPAYFQIQEQGCMSELNRSSPDALLIGEGVPLPEEEWILREGSSRPRHCDEAATRLRSGLSIEGDYSV